MAPLKSLTPMFSSFIDSKIHALFLCKQFRHLQLLWSLVPGLEGLCATVYHYVVWYDPLLLCVFMLYFVFTLKLLLWFGTAL